MSLNKFDSDIYNINNSSNELYFKNNNTVNFSGMKNNIIKNSNGIKSNLDYRKYLVQNGNKIINNNSMLAQNECGYSKNMFKMPNLNPQMSPYVYNSSNLNNLIKPEGYETSDLKEDFINRQRIEMSKKSFTL